MSFKEYLLEAGDTEGTHELVKTSLADAVSLAKAEFAKAGKDFQKILPSFEKNFLLAQKMARQGHTVRKDMPVIKRKDVWLLQRHLLRGALDINKPYAPETKPSNPFPQGLKGKEAERFLKAGFRDGNVKDDVVSYRSVPKAAKDLKPIQQQIYLDKAINFTITNDKQDYAKSVKDSYMLASDDSHILDGHHRWLACMLFDPKITMSALIIDMHLDKLLKVLLAYGDAIGNERNA